MIGPQFRVERSGPAERPLRVAVQGDLDYAHHREFEDVVAELVASVDAGESVVVDLAGVPYCDSCGLRALLGASQRVEARGARLVLHGVSGQPRRALRLTGLDTVFDAGDDTDGDEAGVDGPGAVQA